jgi:glycosyltransferase involved in cell wall biosynthesis
MSIPPLVSVIIPMYNCARFIQQCLDSVAAQTWGNVEAILVDDCSTDDTVRVCRTMAEKDKRFSLICAPENGGPGQARNIGLSAARGDFLTFVDADDWLKEDAISILMNARNAGRSELVVSAFDKIQDIPQGSIRVSHFPEDRNLTKQEISNYALHYMREPGKFMMFSYCWGRLFSSSIIKEKNLRFSPDLRICEDVLFNFEYLRHCNNAHYINISAYNYRFGNPESAAMSFVLEGKRPLLFYNDIWAAYQGIFRFVKEFGSERDLLEAEKITRLGHISHMITLLVRACGCARGKPLFELIRKMVNDRAVQENLRYYSPLKGQSRLIPFFLRARLVMPITLLGRHKYRKRYGRKREAA